MKILFVTRKFPPAIGGMENVAARLHEELSKIAEVELVAIRGKRGGKNILLPLAYLGLCVRALRVGKRFYPDVIYVQDGVMAPLGRLLRWWLRCPVAITIHGTEVVYTNPLYRKLIFPSLGNMDHAVVISDGTAEKTHEVLPKLPLTKVLWGGDDSFFVHGTRSDLRRQLSDKVGVELTDQPLLYHSGRLIERKGALWFIEAVLPLIVRDIPTAQLCVGGDGEDMDKIRQVVERLGMQSNVHMLGYVLGETRNLLFSAADLFVMPNIPGYGFEGFGMVAVEASSCGTPVVASRFEGITDAVLDGQTGWLLPTKDAAAFAEKIVSELHTPTLDRAAVRQTVLATFNWSKTAENYLQVFKSVSPGINK